MADSINRVLAQPKQRPTLANLKRVCPQDLAHCEGYVWHLGTRIGKGSFGEVYLGWSSVSVNVCACVRAAVLTCCSIVDFHYAGWPHRGGSEGGS